MLLTVAFSGPGSFVASGKNLVTSKGTAPGFGLTTLKLKLTAAGKKQLQKKGKLKVKVKVTFTPTGDSPLVATKMVTFKKK